ncbi:hypothetical protein RhiirC2_395291 [Rhizophagus irregularis]|uniref:Uncharacterized protein n=1 Tax=Rhizophagus irregularis TaxID=588596 RepID=A0A2N1NDZ9_9GLOM|nr:hypothetical protein RhiirC2_395291 [Rhizophagus irregularis]
MQISLFYQQQHHLQQEASEKQLQILESYGIIVYSAPLLIQHFIIQRSICYGEKILNAQHLIIEKIIKVVIEFLD